MRYGRVHSYLVHSSPAFRDWQFRKIVFTCSPNSPKQTEKCLWSIYYSFSSQNSTVITIARSRSRRLLFLPPGSTLGMHGWWGMGQVVRAVLLVASQSYKLQSSICSSRLAPFSRQKHHTTTTPNTNPPLPDSSPGQPQRVEESILGVSDFASFILSYNCTVCVCSFCRSPTLASKTRVNSRPAQLIDAIPPPSRPSPSLQTRSKLLASLVNFRQNHHPSSILHTAHHRKQCSYSQPSLHGSRISLAKPTVLLPRPTHHVD